MAHNLQTLANNNYSWVDALFMGMGNWPRAYARTNAEAYLQKMDSLYESTRDTGCGAVGMYNAGDGLWYRDCGFVGKTDTNGQPIYWSRGNGWVMGALAEVLQSLPLGNSHRLQYEQMLQTSVRNQRGSARFRLRIKCGVAQARWPHSRRCPAGAQAPQWHTASAPEFSTGRHICRS